MAPPTAKAMTVRPRTVVTATPIRSEFTMSASTLALENAVFDRVYADTEVPQPFDAAVEVLACAV